MIEDESLTAAAVEDAAAGVNITLWRCLAGLSSVALMLRRRRNRSRSRKQQGGGTPSNGKGQSKAYLAFRRMYLVPYLFATAADWLKGPFIYTLYEKTYGYEQEQITLLFTTGYAAGAVTGLIAGAMADKYGRRRACMAYGFLQIMANLMACCGPSIYPLFLGRVASGECVPHCFEWG